MMPGSNTRCLNAPTSTRPRLKSYRLQGVTDLKNAFPNAVVGFSDHSIGPEMALASVALGACILERHLHDTRYRIGPDIINSMDPSELRHIIDRQREIHTALHNPKQRTPVRGRRLRLCTLLGCRRPRSARRHRHHRGRHLGTPPRIRRNRGLRLRQSRRPHPDPRHAPQHPTQMDGLRSKAGLDAKPYDRHPDQRSGPALCALLTSAALADLPQRS